MLKSDSQLPWAVRAELLWDPRVEQERVSVRVEDGIVTLSGAVSTLAAKAAAFDAARHARAPHRFERAFNCTPRVCMAKA